VTLDVSKLSGWLNAVADCRVQREAWEEGDMQAGGRGRGLECASERVGSIQVEDWAGAEPHLKHSLHVCDAGRVETQRLVERRRRLPSPKGGMLRGRHGGLGDGRAWGWRWCKQPAGRT